VFTTLEGVNPSEAEMSRPRWIPPLGTNKALESNEFADTKSLQYRALCFEVPTPKHSGFPKQQWKNIRTTNVIERLNGEFRRRVKTQGSLPSEDAALVLLFGLIATGQNQAAQDRRLQETGGGDQRTDEARGLMSDRYAIWTIEISRKLRPFQIQQEAGRDPPKPRSS